MCYQLNGKRGGGVAQIDNGSLSKSQHNSLFIQYLILAYGALFPVVLFVEVKQSKKQKSNETLQDLEEC